MAVGNSLVKEEKKLPFQAFVKNDAVLKNIQSTLGDMGKAQRFVASIISAVSTNPNLQKCESATIISSALLGEALNLSPSPQLGHYYIVPFEDRKNKRTNATFQLGYKGYLQLAIRSGQYKKINVVAIKKGELVSYNPFDEELIVTPMQDEIEREDAPTVGYYAMFELVNGFKKTMYWSKGKMLVHADKYSQAFHLKATGGNYPKVSYADFEEGKVNESEKWQYSSFWYKDFDGMAFKTMLRQLISKWGIMSIELQSAFENDMSYKDVAGKQVYTDNDADFAPSFEPIETEATQIDQTTGEVLQPSNSLI